MNNEIFKHIINRILEKSVIEDSGNENFDSGKKIAYIEILSMIKNDLESFNLPLDEFNMNFDVDNMY